MSPLLSTLAALPLLLVADTADVFRATSPPVFQIVIEREGHRVSFGTGFFVGYTGEAITAYHVVDEAVLQPETHSIVAVRGDTQIPVEVLDVDPRADVALLQLELDEPTVSLRLADVPDVGTAVYCLGKPADTGITVVEGTYRGETKDGDLSLGAALAPGMSGGPTVIESGDVVGINVARGPHTVGLIAPVSAALALAGRYSDRPERTALTRMTDRLLERERTALEQTLSTTVTAQVGAFRVPAPGRCERSEPESTERGWTETGLVCTVAGSQKLAARHGVNPARVTYLALGNESLVAPQFWDVVDSEAQIQLLRQHSLTSEFECEVRVADLSQVRAKVVICSRDHTSFPMLHDIAVGGVTLGSSQEVLVFRVAAWGFTRAGATRFADHILRRIAPAPRASGIEEAPGP